MCACVCVFVCDRVMFSLARETYEMLHVCTQIFIKRVHKRAEDAHTHTDEHELRLPLWVRLTSRTQPPVNQERPGDQQVLNEISLLLMLFYYVFIA